MEYFADKDKWLKFTIPVHSDEWFKFRTVGLGEAYEGGVGASEVGKFIGYDTYRPVSAEVFYMKIGLMENDRFYNEKIYWGQTNEDRILDAWRFQEANIKGSYAENHLKYRETNDSTYIQRESVDIPYYLINKSYPWLFASLDSGIAQGSPMISKEGHWMVDENGEVLVTDRICPLECKNMGSYSLKQYEGGMNPAYIAQVHSQMLVTKSTYSEIVVLVDGSDLRLFPIELDVELAELLLRATKAFWDKVLIARQIVPEYQEAQFKGNKNKAEKLFGEIQSLEPEVTNGMAYADWIKEGIKNPGEVMNGTAEQYLQAKRYKYLNSVIKFLKDEKQLEYNKFLDSMKKQGVGRINLGSKGSVGYSPTSGRLSVRGINDTTKKELEELLKRMGI